MSSLIWPLGCWVAVVTAFMQVSADEDYSGFIKLLNKARPKQIEMPLFDSLLGNNGLSTVVASE
jgi:hypothetical protein